MIPVKRLSWVNCCQSRDEISTFKNWDQQKDGFKSSRLHSGKLTWLAGKWTLNEDGFSIKDGDIPLIG